MEVEKRRKIGEKRVKEKRRGEETSIIISQVHIENYEVLSQSYLSFSF